MKLSLKKIITSGLFATVIAASVCSSAYASMYRVTIGHVDVYDDGDNEPDGAGEITFRISVNDIVVYNEYKSVSDKGDRVVNIDKSINLKLLGNEAIRINAYGDEYDKFSGNEHCWGDASHPQNKIGSKKLNCGKGDMGYYLYYTITKLN